MHFKNIEKYRYLKNNVISVLLLFIFIKYIYFFILLFLNRYCVNITFFPICLRNCMDNKKKITSSIYQLDQKEKYLMFLDLSKISYKILFKE